MNLLCSMHSSDLDHIEVDEVTIHIDTVHLRKLYISKSNFFKKISYTYKEQ